MVAQAINLAIGVVGGILTTVILRLTTTIFDFMPKNLDTIGIGTSFEPFLARGPGDNYDAVLRVAIRNHGAQPLYVVRCVYFRDRRRRIPVYVNARRSQKYRKGYEAKFGEQWQSMQVLIAPDSETMTYVPLAELPADEEVEQGRRGRLLIEYVYCGKAGIHRASL